MRSPQTPLVTVLMPVYNAQSYLKEAIDSILNQSHTDFEFLIVDDGSTDESVNIINSYSDSRIRLIQQSNAGVSGALNTGLSLAKGKYIVRFDADDVRQHPEALVQVDVGDGVRAQLRERGHAVLADDGVGVDRARTLRDALFEALRPAVGAVGARGEDHGVAVLADLEIGRAHV